MHKVDPAAAEKLYRRAWKLDYSTDTYTDVKQALESTYNSLGAGTGVGLVTCARVGDLYDGAQVIIAPGCTSGNNVATIQYMAGYEPLTDVSEHAEIDLDLQHIIAGLGGTCGNQCALSDCSQTSDKDTGIGCKYDVVTLAFPKGDTCQWDGLRLPVPGSCSVQDPANYDHISDAKAFDVWLNGANSQKSSGMRAISGFASGAATKGDGAKVAYRDNKHISVMNDYWKIKGLDQYTWGEDMVRAAFEGTSVGDVNFGEVGRTFRKEAIQKGIMNMNIFPYVIWEMQDQVNDCKAGILLSNDDNSVHAWDEAVAFYTGSKLLGTGVNPSSPGILQYALADKRCKNFRTCADGFEGGAAVNQHIWQLFARGRDAVREAGGLTGSDLLNKCDIAEDSMDKIAALSLIPFIQGTLRYLYNTRSYASSKEAGELWAFATPILPFVHKVDPAAAEKLYRRAWKLDYTTDSYTAVKEALESTYNSLGVGMGVGLVTCADVCEMYNEGQEVVIPGCSDSS